MDPIMTCPSGSNLDPKTKMCMMTPIMTCSNGYVLSSDGKCSPSAPPAPTADAGMMMDAAPIQAAAAPPAGMEPQCPVGYEFKDSMCYPLKI